MNPSTAFGVTFTDELVRCGLREVVLAPGSRSTPLAMAFFEAARQGRLRLHVRIDERSAAFTALGLAKASRLAAAVLCTSGTAAANFHSAVVEADESGIPLILLTADRPPELRGTGANQAIDQIKLYGGAVRWFCEAGLPEARPGAAGYWRSLACQAWAHASGHPGGRLQGSQGAQGSQGVQGSGPVHLNLPFREPLVPDGEDGAAGWPEPLDGRPGGQPWTRVHDGPTAGGGLELPWTERGVVVCGDGDYDALALVELAERAGWPVLAEPSSGARRGPAALSAYQYLLAAPEFVRAHPPDVIVSAGRPGLSRPQAAFLSAGREGAGREGAGREGAGGGGAVRRHVVVAQGPGRWADPQRAATDITPAVRLTGTPGGRGWLDRWLRADEAARRAVDAVLDDDAELTEPRLARDLASALPPGSLLWCASSQPVRDLDCGLPPRADLRVLASRGTSGIDGTTSSAIGAALAHGGPAFALIGDLAFLHDAAGLALGPDEPRPDLCLVVVNNDGGGIFSALEQAAFPDSFERLFGTPHGASLYHLASAFGLPYQRLEQPGDLTKAVQGTGLRIVEAQTSRTAGAGLRARLRAAAAEAIRGM